MKNETARNGLLLIRGAICAPNQSHASMQESLGRDMAANLNAPPPPKEGKDRKKTQ
jgi:hypothetical protein